MSFLQEIKRRKVFQVAAVYLVVAWLTIQVVDVVSGPLLLPDVFARIVIVVLAIGFPIAVILSWAFDLTPEGVVRDHGADQRGGRRIEYVLLALLVLATGWIVYREINPPALNGGEILANSIAVLPCENLSPDPDNAYFAAGIHDEMLYQLSKIRDLNVIARPSMLQYADAARPITEIAQELNVGSVMVCSVSYAENRVAVALQLIDAETGVILWSRRYNEELANVFGMQADIAFRTAVALEAELQPDERESIEERPTDSEAAYDYYLKALAIGLDSPTMLPAVREIAIGYLNDAVEQDPDFALAHAQLAWGYLRSFTHPVAPGAWLSRRAELEALIRRNVDRALQLDPELGLAWAVLGQLHQHNWDITEADDAYDKALQLSPRNLMVVFTVANTNWFRDVDQEVALQLARRAVELDPYNFLSWNVLGQALYVGQEYEEAAVAFRKDVELAPAEAVEYIDVARADMALGEDASALAALRKAEGLTPAETNPHVLAYLAWGYGRLGYRDDAERLLTQIKSVASETYISPGSWAMLYLGVGDYGQALAALNEAIENPRLLMHYHSFAVILQNAYLDTILEQPEWLEVRRKLGYWE